MARAIVSVLVAVAVAVGGVAFAPAPAVVAATASNFDPTYIISDDIFYNSSLMSDAQVQTFFESKESACSASSSPGCLRYYKLSTPAKPATNYCGLYQGGTNELASHILYNVAVACNINPQVLIVLLQKEQSLVTANNPSPAAYQSATGFGCPDTAACDSSYYGFFNQVYQAAAHFQSYVVPANHYTYQAGRPVAVSYRPGNRGSDGSRCDAPVLTIQNNATAALYNYTPYQPNAAAMANLYGTGDVCSSYGNRNFWVYFTDWFGSTTISPANNSFVKAVYQDVLNRQPSDGERINWGKALSAGMPRSQVAGGFVNSDEFRTLKIDFAYQDVLGRAADPGGELSWLNGMRSGALTPDDVYRIFLQTPEYYQSSGNTDATFVAAMYQKIIKRPAVQSEIDYWVGMLRQYGQATVVNLIWFSTETARARVAQMYHDYLGRDPDDPGLIQWGDYALKYGDSWVRSAILGSDEYLARAKSRYP